MLHPTTTLASTDLDARTTRLCLLALVLGAVILRLPGLTWLVGVGHETEFSFMLDDQRFTDLAHDFDAGMPDGYVHGMTSHLLVLLAIVQPFLPDPNLLQLLRVVTLIYAGMTVALVYFFARSWNLPRSSGLLSAFFLAVAPVHVATSNYGTADVTAVFYFYAAIFSGAQYLRSSKIGWFVTAAALTGAGIAVKLFIPLLVPLFLLVLVHRAKDILVKSLLAATIAFISFEAYSLFAYGLPELITLFEVLHTDVVAVPGGNSVIRQAVLYAWDSLSAVSLPVAILLAIGCCLFTFQFFKNRHQLTMAMPPVSQWRSAMSPGLLLFSALGAHAVLLSVAGVHAVRHLLVFVPVACIVAAHTLILLLRSTRLRIFRISIVAVVLAYGTANAIALERLYVTDIRNNLAAWVDTKVRDEHPVLALAYWTRIRGTTFDRRADPLRSSDDTYIVTCDLEYQGYLRDRDAAVYGAYGGQARTDFFWDVFEKRSPFRISEVFRQAPLSFEQKLIAAQILRPVGTFIPKTCLVLHRHDVRDDVVAPGELWPRLYFTPGW